MGIQVRAHWMFLVLFYFFLMTMELEQALFVLIGVFGSVFLHELGHSLVARHLGIRVLDITFWPLGGMARMAEMPESPRIEGLVAIAGPAVNFIIVAISLLVSFLAGLAGFDAIVQPAILLAGVNLMIGTFNLAPGFPMDGGRILRAWFARSRDWVTATELAVKVGRVVAGLMLIVAVLSMTYDWPGFNACALGAIAIFIYYAGARELLGVRLRHGRSPFGGAPFGGSFTPNAEWYAAQTEGAAAAQPPPHGADEPTGARRPASSVEGIPQHGFSDDYLRELERSHDRLRRPQDD